MPCQARTVPKVAPEYCGTLVNVPRLRLIIEYLNIVLAPVCTTTIQD